MDEVGLRLHPDKTRDRVLQGQQAARLSTSTPSFTFLGYTFRPRAGRAARTGRCSPSFLPAISPRTPEGDEQRLRSLADCTGAPTDALDDLARWINPIVRGWMNYYGRFYRSALYPLLQRINTYLMRWARQEVQTAADLQAGSGGGGRTASSRQPDLFAHWRWVPHGHWDQMRRAV